MGLCVLSGAPWLRKDCARPARANDFFQKIIRAGFITTQTGADGVTHILSQVYRTWFHLQEL
jgi:hypothetical protein